jgi:hypothetical protein
MRPPDELLVIDSSSSARRLPGGLLSAKMYSASAPMVVGDRENPQNTTYCFCGKGTFLGFEANHTAPDFAEVKWYR